ncbi:MAG: hypothetical protein PWP23_3374 [Candidatus Sumerlaeota bacterium]|nr:hypothetical protein [Candidatus Sumerlaeota bacterium]
MKQRSFSSIPRSRQNQPAPAGVPSALLLFLLFSLTTVCVGQGLPKPESAAWEKQVRATPGINIATDPNLDSHLWSALAPGGSEEDPLSERAFDFAQLMVRALGGSGATEIESALLAAGIKTKSGYGAGLAWEIGKFPTSRWIKLQPEQCRMEVLDSLDSLRRAESPPTELKEAGIDPDGEMRIAAVTLGAVAQNGLTVTQTHYLVEQPGKPLFLLSAYGTNRIAFRPGDTPPEVTRMKAVLGSEQPQYAVPLEEAAASIKDDMPGGFSRADRIVFLVLGIGVVLCGVFLLLPYIRSRRTAS